MDNVIVMPETNSHERMHLGDNISVTKLQRPETQFYSSCRSVHRSGIQSTYFSIAPILTFGGFSPPYDTQHVMAPFYYLCHDLAKGVISVEDM